VTIPLRSGAGQDPCSGLRTVQGGSTFVLSRRGAAPEPDVEFETTADPVAETTALATQGENTFLEYKQGLPDDNVTSKRKVLKTVVAFATGTAGPCSSASTATTTRARSSV